jgi:2-oxoisovalerate dehydrogenase E1 component
MAVSRTDVIDQNFTESLSALKSGPRRAELDSPVSDQSRLTARQAIGIFCSMVESRHLDLQSRELKKEQQSFYTIGSSGHEGNAALAAALRPSDGAFLHYRSGAFFIQRARQLPGQSPLLDILLGIVASSDEPIAGGRHKVFGSLPLNIPPQTSTIASHLPKAVGAAFAIERMKRLSLTSNTPDDSLVMCSFGDASSNHSTACGAFNTAALADYQRLPCPVLFVCEDNGLGISVRTPSGWVAQRFSQHPNIAYFPADGLDIADVYEASSQAIEHIRTTRRPALLHLSLVRLLGHAGSDVEQLYRSKEEIEAAESLDPVLGTARWLVGDGWLSSEDCLAIYEDARARIQGLGQQAAQRPKITTAEEVMIPLAPHDVDTVEAEAQRPVDETRRVEFFGKLPEQDRPRHMSMMLNRALGDLLLKYPESVIFGEDVAKKGGVYHVTSGLQEKTGVGRVFNTPLDETAILGLAIGAAQQGMLPIPEIQYLAYLHNAIDQLRGEACSLSFFSQGVFRNPMVVRIAGLAYQKGFGGHFHNDNSVAALRDIPGLLIACPSNGPDAVGMLRTCMAAARVHGQVSVFLEPIALYMTKDIYEEKDGLWCFPHPPSDHTIAVGKARTWTEGRDLTILSYGNGLWMSLRVARRLEGRGFSVRVVDLRWLNPLPREDMVHAAESTGRVLVVDECRQTGGMAESIITALVEDCPDVQMKRISAADTYIPLGAAANLVLVQEDGIEAAALEMLESK